MARYAANTTVGVDRTLGEIRNTLRRFGAEGFGFGEQDGRAIVGFEYQNRRIRFELALEPKSAFALSPAGRRRTPASALAAYEQETRRRWRSLALLIKAKLAAVEDGVVSFETEFLANVVLPDGRIVAEHALPAVEKAYLSGNVPRLLGTGN